MPDSGGVGRTFNCMFYTNPLGDEALDLGMRVAKGFRDMSMCNADLGLEN